MMLKYTFYSLNELEFERTLIFSYASFTILRTKKPLKAKATIKRKYYSYVCLIYVLACNFTNGLASR